MKESAQTHEKVRSSTYTLFQYIHVSVSDTLSTYGRLLWRVAFSNKDDRMFAAITTQPQCLQNVSTRLDHTQTKEEERRGVSKHATTLDY